MSPRCQCFGLLGFPNPSFRVSPLRTMSTSCGSGRLVLCSGTFPCFFHPHSVLPLDRRTPSLSPLSSIALRYRPSLASCSCSLWVHDQVTPMLLQPILQHRIRTLDTRLVLLSSSGVGHIRHLRFLRPNQRQCLHMQSIGCASSRYVDGSYLLGAIRDRMVGRARPSSGSCKAYGQKLSP